MTENRYAVYPCTPEMLGDIVTVERQSFSCPWSAESLRLTAEREDSIFLTVCRGENAVAFGCILLAENEGELVDIAVAPEHRQKGLGQLLLAALLAEAQNRGAEQIFLEVRESNKAARGLYEKNGFVPIGRRKKYYKNPVEDAVVMQLLCSQ